MANTGCVNGSCFAARGMLLAYPLAHLFFLRCTLEDKRLSFHWQARQFPPIWLASFSLLPRAEVWQAIRPAGHLTSCQLRQQLARWLRLQLHTEWPTTHCWTAELKIRELQTISTNDQQATSIRLVRVCRCNFQVMASPLRHGEFPSPKPH